MYDSDIMINMGIAMLLGYAIGSIPFGLLLTKLGGMGDIRNIGSGNIGATNVLRTGNKKIAIAVLLLDGVKGAAAMGLILWLGMAQWWRDDPVMLAGLMAVLGHNFPIWLRFKGGKGVATSLGVITMLAWPAGIAALMTWLITAMIFRYSSVAALVGLGLSPVYMWVVTHDYPACYLVILLGFLSFVRHRANIARLVAAKEPKIKLSSKG